MTADLLQSVGQLQDAIWAAVGSVWREWFELNLTGQVWRTRSAGSSYWFEVDA